MKRVSRVLLFVVLCAALMICGCSTGSHNQADGINRNNLSLVNGWRSSQVYVYGGSNTITVTTSPEGGASLATPISAAQTQSGVSQTATATK